jgi:hypothetical protein
MGGIGKQERKQDCSSPKEEHVGRIGKFVSESVVGGAVAESVTPALVLRSRNLNGRRRETRVPRRAVPCCYLEGIDHWCFYG